jgi:HPr kinase/phosphorylase
MTALKLKDILEGAEDKLGFEQMTGKAGLMRRIDYIGVQRYDEEERFWDRLIPDVILIITPLCLSELAMTSSESREKIFQTIISCRIPCVALSNTDSPPDFMLSFSELHSIPLFMSMYDEFLLESRVLGLLREKIDKVISIHGALVNVFGIGVIIAGDSGTGKTECARDLAERGHAWIADDVIEIEKRENILYGHSHDLIKYLIHIKRKGIIDAKKFFIASAVLDETVINLLVELVKTDDIWRREVVYSAEKFQDIMGVKLSYVQLPCFPHTENIYKCVEQTVQRLLNERIIA